MTIEGATAKAAQALRRRITSGDLAPGSRLTEDRMASELGVSRAPLREAMRLLEEEGLLTSIPYRGVRVTALTPQDAYEIATLRATLEEMAVRIGVPVTDPLRLARLEEAFARMSAHALEGDEDSAAEDSYRFHLAVIGLAGHARLERAYRSLALQLAMYANRRARAGTESLVRRAERHRPVLERVRAGDTEGVLEALGDGADISFVRRLGAPPALTPEASQWYARLGAP